LHNFLLRFVVSSFRRAMIKNRILMMIRSWMKIERRMMSRKIFVRKKVCLPPGHPRRK